MSKKFQRRIEDFVCENCGTTVKGTGYTNHCPKCLCSKHVDINPGDRANSCGGLMKPFGIELSHGEYVIIHKCIKCGFQKKNKTKKDDNIDLIIKISSLK
jgi:hypothetical protein